MIFEFEHHIFAIYSYSRFSKLQTKCFAQIAYSFSACKDIKDENIEEVRFLFPVKYIVHSYELFRNLVQFIRISMTSFTPNSDARLVRRCKEAGLTRRGRLIKFSFR